MRRITLILPLALASAMLAGGCQPQYTEPAAAQPEMTPEQQQFQRLWEASRRVLTRYGFHIDRQDPRAGVITTWPMVGKQLAEFWRRDAARTADAFESTVQTIYRSASVTVGKTDSGFEPTVEVFVSRSDKPTGSISTTSDAYNLFARRPKKQEISGQEEAAQLVELGNDRLLEAKIRQAILEEAGKPTQ